MSVILPFNPLDKKNLGASVAEALLTNDVRPLNNLESFEGAGVYVIYYTGDFAPYAQMAASNQGGQFKLPIYVGKAVPAGARMGGGLGAPPGRVLWRRLKEHAESVRAAENLDIEDFHCRLLVVDDIWIPLGESLMIARFTPIWNSLIDGFGNHNPGSGRHAGMRPRWDVLHPGRAWASRLKERPESADEIAADAEIFLRERTPNLSSRFIDAHDQ
jgi:hypothetical protein